jgi:hypothetical protein
MSPEEFFMYLTIGLIVLVPVGARLYRRMTLRQTQAMLRQQFGDGVSGKSQPTEKGQ